MAGPFVSSDNSGVNEVPVPCPCEGTPHEKDTVYIRATLSGAEVAQISGAMFGVDENSKPTANMANSQMKAMELCVTGWTFTNGNGGAIPFDPLLTNMLRADIWSLVQQEVDKLTDTAKAPKENLNSDGTIEDTKPVKSLTGGSSDPMESSPSSSTPSPVSVFPER